MRVPALKVGGISWIGWYVRQLTGEAKWDEYLERCGHEGVEPISRRDFERHRSEHQENNPQARCC